MGKLIDLTGQRFGRLSILSRQGTTRRGQPLWLCLCDCGNKRTIQANSFGSGNTTSCGCLSRELAKSRFTTHGMATTSTYNIWKQMLQRCKNKNNTAYKNYGGRGIIVCERWLKFENFYTDMGKRPKHLTIERINNYGNYELSNCKWATRTEQNNNSRRNITIAYKDQHLTVTELAIKVGLKYATLFMRLKRNWPIERALTMGVKQ